VSRRRIASLVGITLAVAMVGLVPAAGARGGDGSIVRNVLVPGETGSLPTDAHSTDQIPLYDGLAKLFDHVTAKDLTTFFKDESLGDTRGTAEATPRTGLKIVRDNFNVPHIFGSTRFDTEFGAGWVAAEDRSLLIETLRGPARIAALDAPGLDAFALASSLRKFDSSPQTEQFLAGQAKVLEELGPQGRQVLADVDAYVAGINAFYSKSHNGATPWTRNDVLAASALIGAVFGRGGGGEVRNAELLAQLRAKFGNADGTKVFRDLREAQDPEAPTTITERFPYEPIPTGSTPGSAVIDLGSTQAVSALLPKQHMSNALLVEGGRSVTGNPLAVMGPQVGYYYPEILMEMDLHGGGLDARGASFPGTSLYVELGRGKNYAWSATSSDSDNIDQFLEQLCNPDGSTPTRASDHYVVDGRCVAMTSFDAGVLRGTGGQPDQQVMFHETRHGPVSGTVTVGGKPYAVTTQRSTHGREPASALGFMALNENRVHGPASFQRAANQIEYTFNWFYVDDRHVSFFSSGRLPKRAPGTDPSLPTLGTGQWDWRGFLSQEDHPHATDPDLGLLLNWNNKPAPGFGAADDNWGFGPVQHVQLFAPFKRRSRLEDVASIMNKAATQDDRAVLIWPVVARLLATGPAPDARSQQAAALVTTWLQQGASRLDRNGDGKIDAAGAAVLDRAWPLLTDAVLRPVLGPVLDAIPRSGVGGYVQKDLRTILGEPVNGRYSRIYCGSGDLPTCRASVWGAIKQAADGLAASQGSDPNAWRSPAGRIRFVPGILPNTIQAVNRPTFQQVVSFDG
jgi:acyl-homoserine lactone acylase PvdQ